jgi:L-lactate dehydrogenase
MFAEIAIRTVDVLAQVAQETSGLPACRVIGTGTLIDTARLRNLLAGELGVEPRAVEAYIIGEHGESEIAVWSGACVAGLPLALYPGADELAPRAELLDQIRNAAPEVVRRKGNTAYAIALCIERICEAVLRDEHAVLAVSARIEGHYGLDGVYLGTPCVIGKNGIARTSHWIWTKTNSPAFRHRPRRSRRVWRACNPATWPQSKLTELIERQAG